jgi:hypothetical protein
VGQQPEKGLFILGKPRILIYMTSCLPVIHLYYLSRIIFCQEDEAVEKIRGVEDPRGYAKSGKSCNLILGQFFQNPRLWESFI